MKTHLFTFLLVLVTAPAFADTFGSGDNQFTIDFVTIGNLCSVVCDRTAAVETMGELIFLEMIAQ